MPNEPTLPKPKKLWAVSTADSSTGYFLDSFTFYNGDTVEDVLASDDFKGDDWETEGFINIYEVTKVSRLRLSSKWVVA